jgi:hypothetical protein
LHSKSLNVYIKIIEKALFKEQIKNLFLLIDFSISFEAIPSVNSACPVERIPSRVFHYGLPNLPNGMILNFLFYRGGMTLDLLFHRGELERLKSAGPPAAGSPLNSD